MTDNEKREWDLKLQQVDATIANLNAETGKINKTLDAEVAKIIAETSKINRERWFYPFTVMTTSITASILIILGVLKLLNAF